MRKQSITFLILVTLCACTPQSANTARMPIAYNEQMAEDTVHILTTLYPAASTHIVLSKTTGDAYGQALEKKLRETGYAVENGSDLSALFITEPAPLAKESKAALNAKSSSPDATHVAAPVTPVSSDSSAIASPTTMPLSYIVDRIGDKYYRLTLRIQTQSVSRVYTISGNHLVAAGVWTRGSWTRKE